MRTDARADIYAKAQTHAKAYGPMETHGKVPLLWREQSYYMERVLQIALHASAARTRLMRP